MKIVFQKQYYADLWMTHNKERYHKEDSPSLHLSLREQNMLIYPRVIFPELKLLYHFTRILLLHIEESSTSRWDEPYEYCSSLLLLVTHPGFKQERTHQTSWERNLLTKRKQVLRRIARGRNMLASMNQSRSRHIFPIQARSSENKSCQCIKNRTHRATNQLLFCHYTAASNQN